MRVFFGLLGGILALALSFHAWSRSVTHDLPIGTQVGIPAKILLRPSFVLWETLCFAVGFTLAYIISRPRA